MSEGGNESAFGHYSLFGLKLFLMSIENIGSASLFELNTWKAMKRRRGRRRLGKERGLPDFACDELDREWRHEKG